MRREGEADGEVDMPYLNIVFLQYYKSPNKNVLTALTSLLSH